MSAELIEDEGEEEERETEAEDIPDPVDVWTRVRAAAEEDPRIVVFLFKALLDYLVEDPEVREQILINAVNTWVAEYG